MPGEVRLNQKELDGLIEQIEAGESDATELKKLRGEVAEEERTKKPAEHLSDEEFIAELRGQSTIEHGTDLECLVCHNKVDELVSGTCEACFRKWALTTKRR